MPDFSMMSFSSVVISLSIYMNELRLERDTDSMNEDRVSSAPSVDYELREELDSVSEITSWKEPNSVM